MSHLIETLRIENGIPSNLSYHEDRFRNSLRYLFGISPVSTLSSIIKCPEQLRHGVVKCRVVYERSILNIAYEPYVPRRIRTLRMVECNTIDYSFKYEDREIFNRLKEGIEEEEILIIKNGLLTDLSFANVALRKDDKWFTPASPLLKGTRRAALLKEERIITIDIRQEDLKNYQELRYFNALVDWSETEPIKVNNIR